MSNTTLSDVHPEYGEWERGSQEKPTCITCIRATDVACGLGRIPAGFCTVVHHSDLTWRTEVKGLSVDNDVVEWDGPIPIPCDPSATLSFEIYASFEFQPVLGNGEQLRKLTITVEQLLDNSAKHAPFVFHSDDGNVLSPCLSILVTVGRQKHENAGSSASTVFGPYSSTTESRSELENATNEGHDALCRYRKHKEKRDLEHAIEHFQHALDICPLDRLCRAAAQSNLAMAKFTYNRVDDAYGSLDVPLTLYRDALAARPAGHPDRPSTLIQLATVHLARFEKARDEVDATQAKTLLREAINLSSAESHEKRTAISVLQQHTGHEICTVQAASQSSVGRDSVSGSPNEDSWASSAKLLLRFQQFGDIDDVQRAISILEASIRSTVISDRRYLGGLMNLGAALLYRFRCLGEPSDLEQAISKFSDAVSLTPDDHPNRPDCLSNLAASLKDRFGCLGEPSDLEQAISRHKDALDLTPTGHADRARYLCNLGNALRTRFECLGELRDLEQAISRLSDALDLTPDGLPHRYSYLDNLGSAFFVRFQRLGELNDLERAISRLRDAADLTPHDHPDKPASLNNLGSTFFARFERFGELTDLEQAISTYRDAVDFTPVGHTSRPGHLANLGNAFLTRFEQLNELSDLERATSAFEDAVDLTPEGHPAKAGYLNNFGNAFRVRFERFGEVNQLEQAISRYRDAVDLTSDGHPDKRDYLNNLGASLNVRFQRLRKLSDLEEAISRLDDALDATPDDHPDKPVHLHNLGGALLSRFEQLGNLNDLGQAIWKLRYGVDLTPDGHPEKPMFLDGLGVAFSTRFERLGELGDLEDAILRHKDAVDLAPDGHLDKITYSKHLGQTLRTRFERLGGLGDLEEAIWRFRNAVDQTPDGHPDKSDHLNSLGVAFTTRFKHLGGLSDIEEAVLNHKHSVDLTPDAHPDKPARLDSLGNAFNSRFERLGELRDLEDAISAHKDAVDLSPDSHRDKFIYLHNLACTFETRFERFGELSDLEQAISRFRSTVEVLPDGHSDKPVCVNNLGSSFLARFNRLGEINDLKQAISRFQDAVDLIPYDHPFKYSILNNLGISFLRQFHSLGEFGELEQAISTFKEALDHIHNDHPNKPACLTNFTRVLLARFRHRGESNDLDQAISMDRIAVDITPDGHPHRPSRLNNLSGSLVTRFDHLGDLSDLEEAISRLRDAVNLNPDAHPEKLGHVNNLGEALMRRFVRLAEVSDLEEAMSLYSQSARASTGPPTDRFNGSQKWIKCARALGHQSLLDAYSSAIGLLPELAWIGLPITHRYRELLQGADVAREAAAAALDSGSPQNAVEWLEQGRSIVWGSLFQLRSAYEELSSAYPDHARQLQQLSTALEHASVTREKSLSLLSEQIHPRGAHRTTPSLEQEADRHRALAIKRDCLLQEIRGFPGFERFLLHKQFSQLRAAAHSGPVVILNAAESRCDALIICADAEDVIHVPLPKFTLERSAGLQKLLKGLLRDARAMPRDEREGQRMRRAQGIQWEALLSTLWKCVVKPVLDSLAISIPGKLSRIFWCPTGPFTFLPIHAAGLYDAQHSQPGNKVFDIVISSYTPTLSILVPSTEPDTTPSHDLRFLAIRQPSTDGQRQLPGVDVELAYIRAIISNTPLSRTTLLEPTDGTVEEVLALMKEADWVHFSCHGIQDTTSPSESGLCLADGRRLKLSDVIALSRPRGGLAFLSACQTATGDEGLSDEAIHVAAGMLFAGYGGVVGTMWSISDKLAPGVAKDMYERLFKCTDGAGRPDYRDAARALHDAVARLRGGEGNGSDEQTSFVEWLPFIHVGL